MITKIITFFKNLDKSYCAMGVLIGILLTLSTNNEIQKETEEFITRNK